jgi:hypothetical protein
MLSLLHGYSFELLDFRRWIDVVAVVALLLLVEIFLWILTAIRFDILPYFLLWYINIYTLQQKLSFEWASIRLFLHVGIISVPVRFYKVYCVNHVYVFEIYTVVSRTWNAPLSVSRIHSHRTWNVLLSVSRIHSHRTWNESLLLQIALWNLQLNCQILLLYEPLGEGLIEMVL